MAQAEVTKDANDGGRCSCVQFDAWARAATFDCDKASTSVQKVISDTRLTNRMINRAPIQGRAGIVQRRGTSGAKGTLSSAIGKDSDQIRRPTTIVSVF